MGLNFKFDIGFNKLAVASRIDLHVSRIKTTDAKSIDRESAIAKLSKTFGNAFASDKQFALAA